jgi:hypothetical protein
LKKNKLPASFENVGFFLFQQKHENH